MHLGAYPTWLGPCTVCSLLEGTGWEPYSCLVLALMKHHLLIFQNVQARFRLAEGPGKDTRYWPGLFTSLCWCWHSLSMCFHLAQAPAWPLWSLVMCVWQVTDRPQPTVSVRVRVKVDGWGGHEKEEGSDEARALGQVSKQAREKQGCVIQVYSLHTAQSTPGGDEWGWGGTHSLLTKPRSWHVAFGLEEASSWTEVREEWLSRTLGQSGKTARPTKQDIKNMAAKPREGWPAQVLNAKTVWVGTDWWLGAAPLCSDKLWPWEQQLTSRDTSWC